MDTNQNPFAFLNDTTGTTKPKQATGGSDFSFLQPQNKPIKLGALSADELGALAKEEGADHLLPVINAIYGQESGAGANGKTSTDGAMGGMQIMPDTFKRFAKQGENIGNPADNMRVGMRIIKSLGDKFGNDPAKIATGYFSGEGNVNSGNGSAWKTDHKDGNGKSVSGYVSDVLGRLSPVKEAKAEQNLPDLNQIPKWSQIATSERFMALSPEEQTKLKGAYFDDNIAPYAGAEASKAREAFMAQRDSVPSLGEKIDTKIAGIAPAVKDLFGLSGKKNTGSVMDGFDPAAPQTGLANLSEAMKTSKTLRDVDAGVENRRARLIGQGEDPRFADRAAREAAAAGVVPGAEIAFMQKQNGTIGKSDFDFETSDAFKNQTGVNNPLVRGAARAGLGTTKALSGYTQFMGDVLGIDGMQQSGVNVGKWARGKEGAIGEKGTFLERNLEGAINSIGQQLPLMITGVKLESEALPLAGMAMQTFGQEYSDGRSIGQTPTQATQRAAIFAAFEVIGEKFGLRDSMQAIKAAAKGMPNDQIIGFLWSALKKEVPGELLTTTGQFATDKLPTIGLNQQATGEDYLKQVADTITQTVMQSGLMAGGTTGVSTAVRYLRDQSENANVAAIHAEDTRQRVLDRWNQGLFGVPREQATQTPDGRIEPATTQTALPATATATEPSPIDVHPSVKAADSIVAQMAESAGVPLEAVLPLDKTSPAVLDSADVADQDVINLATMRRRQLLAKRDGQIVQVPTPSGLVDQEIPGEYLTDAEAAELQAIESGNPQQIREHYGARMFPSDQSANQNFAQTPAPEVAPVEQPAQGSVFPTATEPGLVAAQENQNAQSTAQTPPAGLASSQAAGQPTGRPVGAATEPQPANQAAAAQADAGNAIGIAGQQVSTESPVSNIALEAARIARRDHPSTVNPRVDRIAAQEEYLRNIARTAPEQARQIAADLRKNADSYAEYAGVSPEKVGSYASIIERQIALQKEGKRTPEFDVSGRNEQQLRYLADNGQPGWKEAAQAELAKRGAAQPAGPQGQFKTADEAQAYISAQRRRAGGKLPKALPLPFTDGSFGLATEGQAGWAEATAFAKANAPKTEKEAKAKRQKQQSVEPQKATEDSLKAASEWWSVHSAADRKSLLLEQYSEAIAATNSELTWDELGSGMQTRIAELYDARQVKPWTGERKTEQDAKIRRKAEEIHAKANDLLGGTFKLSVDQVETLIHEKGMETAEKTLEGLKKSVKEAAKRNKPAKPKGQKNGTEAAETEQAEKEKPQAPDAGTGEAVSQKPKTEKEAKIAKAASDMAAKAGQPVVDGVEAIASRIQQSIAEHNIKANEKIAREQVAKGYITQEQADADLDRTRKMWEDVKPNERTLALAKAIAAKDPRPLVGAWAKEGQGTYGNEGSMAAFEKISGLKLLRLGSAARAKAIFDWAGWSEDRVAADVAERRKANAEQKAAYEAKHQKEHDERIEKRAASELVEFRDTGEKKGIKEYIDDLVAQGFSRIITSKVGAITKTYLANEQGTGYPLPVGLMRDYAELAVRMAVTPKPEAAADKPKTEKEANARRESGAYRQGRNAAFRGYSIQTPTNIRKSVDKEAYQAGWMEGKREADSLLDGKDRVTVGNRTAVPKIADSNGDFVVVWSEERSGKEFKSAEEALKGLRELEEKDKEFEDSLQDIAPRKPKTEREAKAIRESMVAFKHEGLNIYPVKVGGEMKWAVQTVENAAREKSSERQIGGDPLLSSKESAIAEAERMVKEAAAREYDRKEIEANAQEAAAAKEAAAESKNALLGDFYAKKERIVRERAAVTLSKAIRYEGKVMTRAEWVKSLVDSGAKLTVNQVNKIKPMSRTQFNRASNAEQRSHDEKVKRGGKVPEYMIGDYVVNKTEYDYAEYLASDHVSKTAENIDTNQPSLEAIDNKNFIVSNDSEFVDAPESLKTTMAAYEKDGTAAIIVMGSHVGRYTLYTPGSRTHYNSEWRATQYEDSSKDAVKTALRYRSESDIVAMTTAAQQQIKQNADAIAEQKSKDESDAKDRQAAADKEQHDRAELRNRLSDVKFKKEIITLKTDKGASVDIDAYVYQGAAVHKTHLGKGKQYQITHIKTGMHIGASFGTLAEAKIAAARLAQSGNLNAIHSKDDAGKPEFDRMRKISMAMYGDTAWANGDPLKSPELSLGHDPYLAPKTEREAKAQQSKKSPKAAKTEKSVKADKSTEHSADNVQNFGKELEGGRRNRAPSLDKELSEHEIAGQPLSKIWPADEIDGIEDKFAAAVAFAARAEIPAKPRTSYKVARWAQQVQMLRQMAAGIVRIGDEKARDIFNQAMKGSRHFIAKVNLLESIDRDQWSRIDNVYEYPNAYSYLEDGTKVPAASVSVEIDGKNYRFSGAKSVTEEAVLNKVNELLGQKAEDKKMAFEVRGRTGSYFINKKGDKEYRKLKTFADSKEAFSYIKENYADLVAAWDAVKERDNVGKADVRNAENRPRTGKDWLQGKDVTAQQFIDDLGFRGVEFGKWVDQGVGAKERQGMLNQAYEALMDLATIVGVPPKAISLNGSMGLAFGSRGYGSASAHFEPSNLVINLTKTRGAGTLAHEWFHALDNYFARMRGGEKTMKEVGSQAEYRRQNFVTYKPEPLMVHKTQQLGALTMDQLKRYHAENPKSAYYDPANWKADPKHPEGVRPVVEKAFSDLVNTLNDSPMAKRASRNDKGADGYWGRIIERAARSFENYVIHKMDQDGYQNDYLANVTPASDFKRDADRYPYLRPEEVKPVADAFDRLFKTVETKKTDDGHVTMFSRSTAKAPGQWYQSKLETAIDQAPDRVFGKAAQFKLWLASNAAKLGIKKEEIEWSGINEFLDLRQGSNVPKQDLLEFLSNNSVKVQDVMKHNAGKDLYVEESRDEEGTWLVFDADDNVIEAFDSRKSAEGFLTSATKYGSYTLPGGTNYKELLLTLPIKVRASTMDEALAAWKEDARAGKRGVYTESEIDNMDVDNISDILQQEYMTPNRRDQFRSSHWDEPNILAHVRFNDRVDADGNKVLFIEEIQSDWAQEGRKGKFYDPAKRSEANRLEVENQQRFERVKALPSGSDEQNALTEEWLKTNSLIADLREQARGSIPSAPFIKDTKAWVALSIKRMVAYAAENGYDKVAFVNGDQSAERYDLSQQVSAIQYRKNEDGTFKASAIFRRQENENFGDNLTVDQLEDYVGKEVAAKIAAGDGESVGSGPYKQLSGVDLKVGGEGMKSFYDKIVPQVVNDVLKKLGGGQLGKVAINGEGPTQTSDRLGFNSSEIQIKRDMNGRWFVERGERFVAPGEGRYWTGESWSNNEGDTRLFAKKESAQASVSSTQQLGFTVTLEMRQKLQGEGLPLFSRGKSGQGMALRDLKAIVDRARSSLKNLPQVHVLQSPAGLDMENPSQKRLHQEIYRRGAESDVEGVSHDGEIYLFADNLADEFRAEHVLVNHEVGHYGLREVFGRSGLDPILNTIYMTNAKVRKQADALRDKFGLESNAEATEEILVEMAPKELIKLNAWRRLVRHIRDWLSGHGFGKVAERLNSLLKAGMTEQQKADMLVADVVNAARNWVRNGTPSQSSTVQETKLSQADQNDSDLLKRDRANIETATRRLGKFVDAFVDGRVKDGDTQIIGDTPTVLQALGAENLPVQIDGATLHKILDGKHRYFITPEMLKQVPEHFYDPLAVFDSPKDGKPGKIVLTELSDAITGKPVVVAVHLSKKSGRLIVNEISSVYEIGDGAQRNKLNPAALDYFRNEKSLEQTTTPNLSTPLAGVVQSAQDLGKNILTERDVVKQYGPRFSRGTMGQAIRDLQGKALQFYGNQDLKTFNLLNKSINTQYHKALKDKDFGRVYNLIQSMQNHVATASARPAELAPGILHRVDNVIDSVKTLVSKSQSKAIERAGMALFEGTLAGNSVMDGKVWTDEQLVSQFGLNATEIALYRQARKAIDASLTELAAAEAYAMAETYLPKTVREDIIESPEDAEALIMGALLRQIDTAARVNLDEETQNSLQDAKEKVEAIFAQAEKLKKAGYAPLMRFGKYDLTVKAIDPDTGNILRDENDNPVTLFYGRFDSQRKLREAERELRQRYADNPDVRFSSGIVNDSANELYRGVTPETLSVFADAVGANQAMDDYIRLVRSERSALKRKLERKGTPGYSGDLQRVLANFITSNARQSSQQLYGTAVNRAIRRIPREKGDVQKEALALRDYVINPDDNGAFGSSIMFAWFLGGSPAAALINMTQPVMMTLPHLSRFGGVAIASRALTKAVPYAVGAKEISNQSLRKALKQASLQGIVDAQEVFHLYATGTRRLASGPRSQALMTLWGSMFSAVEGVNRRLTFIAAWNMANDKGHKDPYRFAVDAVNQTQGIYNKANRPNWARSSVGRALFTFKTYSIMYVELMHRMWKSGADGKKAVLLMMAIMLLAAGEEGLPGAKALDDIIDTIGQWMGYDTNMRRWKRRHAYELLGQVAGDIALYGVSSMLPLDFGGRLGLGNIIPGTDILKPSNNFNPTRALAELIGPTAGAAQQVVDAAKAMDEGNYGQAAINLMPKAGRDLANAAGMAKRGYARDAAGRKTVDTTNIDAASKAIGFNPTVVANKSRASMPAQQDIQLVKKREADIVHQWAQAVVDGDDKGARAAESRLKEWNRDNPSNPIRITPDQINNRVRLLKTDKGSRITKTAPKEVRGRIGLELMK